MTNLVNSIRQRYFASAALVISLFHIFFLWRFWEYGIEALGINITFFWILMIGFFLLARWHTLTSRTLLWLIPFTVMIISLSIYTNPFTTWISVIIAPIIFFIFTTHESHQNLRASLWSKFLPVTLIYSAFKYLGSIIPGISFYKSIGQDVTPDEKENFGNVAKQVVLGLVILFILSVAVIIPLLSSADASFANIFHDFFEKFFNLFKFISFAKLFNLILGFLLLMGGVYYWRRKINPIKTVRREEINVSQNSNSITVGIVLLGVLFLYLMFIFVQIKTIFVSEFSSNFSDVENMVKTGFWQLFLLTIINILFYVGIYNKYVKNVQRILMTFTLASLLLIASAGYKVFLYVVGYGLSYEKFFAFYTVLFCSLVFIWFISLFVRRGKERVNIICSLAFMALWMYAFATIIPLEKFIFNTNLKLTQEENSRVDINELEMLGFDALPVVEENFDVLIREAREDYTKKGKQKMWKIENGESTYIESDGTNYGESYLQKKVDKEWTYWIERNRLEGTIFKNRDRFKSKEKKKWYEKTFGELFYKPRIKL